MDIKEAIELLKNIKKHTSTMYCNFNDIWKKDTEALQLAIETLVKVSDGRLHEDKWISINEPPKRSNYYNVTWKDIDAICVGEAFYDASKKIFITSFDKQESHDITHYMPLPQPPKGE